MSDTTATSPAEGAGADGPYPDSNLQPPLAGDSFLSPGPGGEPEGLVAETSEGPQELGLRSNTEPGELRREVGAVLRLPEGVAIDPSDIDIEQSDDETMIINMGPQHPSTHGVLRLMLELDGETVLRTKPVIGYLHTGMEKTAEELTYVQGSTNVTRMDYLAPLHNELVLSLAVEALLGVEMPPRSDWIRMLLVELNRVSSHLMWMATNGMDIGSTSMMLPRARDDPGLLREDHRTPHEPQLHPSGRNGGRPARRVGGRRQHYLRHRHAPYR
jgi:NADH-quinone oxidoreductase subunit D